MILKITNIGEIYVATCSCFKKKLWPSYFGSNVLASCRHWLLFTVWTNQDTSAHIKPEWATILTRWATPNSGSCLIWIGEGGSILLSIEPKVLEV